MRNVSRRSAIAGSMGFALASPYIANAAGTTAVVWAGQGFVQEEDIAFRRMEAIFAKVVFG